MELLAQKNSNNKDFFAGGGEMYASKSMFVILLFLLLFGVYFYETLDIMQSVDVIFELLFCFILGKSIFKNELQRKLGWDFKIFVILLLFYPLYSLTLNLNSTKSIFIDTLIQIKPYIAFFTIYYLGIRLDIYQKKTLKKIVLLLFLISVIILLFILILPISVDNGLFMVYGHSSKFYSALIM